MIASLTSGLENCIIPLCLFMRKAFSFFGEGNYNFQKEIVLGGTWLLIIIWGFSSSSCWIILTASPLWMKSRHFWTMSRCEILMWVIQHYHPHFPLLPKALILLGSANGPIWAIGSRITVNLMINQTCVCCQGAFSLVRLRVVKIVTK